MSNINNEIVLEILDAINNNYDIYNSKHDIAIISYHFNYMVRYGLIKCDKPLRTLLDGKIVGGRIIITDFGLELFNKNKIK